MLKPRESIAKLSPYHSPIVSRDGLSLDLNESMAGCSPRVLARLHSLSSAEVSLYPQREVGERLVANFLGIEPEQVLLTNGMDEALSLVFTSYLDPNDELLFADPTFVMYPTLGEALGAQLVRLQSCEDLTLPVADFLARISPRTRVIAIANPNNPTGLAVSRDDLLKVPEAAPNAAVVIDEAYFEFCGAALTCRTMIPDLARHPNLFVARTFSKAYGLAGLRLGVLTGAAEQIDYLRRLSLPFNVNAVALACLEEALADRAFLSEHVAQVKRVGANRCESEGIRRVDAAARSSGPRLIGKPRLRWMCAGHRWDAPTDGWSAAGNSRGDHGDPTPLMMEGRASPPDRYTAATLCGRARRPSLHYCVTGANAARNQATYPHDHDPALDPLQHLHDLCLVWPSEISTRAAVQGHRHQLAHRFCGILFSGTRQSHRLLRVHDSAVEDHPGWSSH